MQKRELFFHQFEVAHLDQILPCLERVLREHGLDFYILGGLARDIHFTMEGVKSLRITRDIDIAAFIPDPADFDKLIAELVLRESFVKVSGNPVRLRHPAGVVVDVLPFNEMTSFDSDMVRFGPAFASFNLKGLHEVYHFGTDEISFEEDHRYKVTTPESIILLKFLAYEDKPEWRQKDLEDIGMLLKYYFDLNDRDIYDNHNDLFKEERELESISAQVIGRKIRHSLLSNDALFNSFKGILEKHSRDLSSTPISILSRQMNKSAEEVSSLLLEIREGLLEER